MDILDSNNEIYLAGVFKTKFEHDYDIDGKLFLSAQMEVMRLSKEMDMVKIVVPEDMFPDDVDFTDVYAEIYGSYRTYKKDVEGKKRQVPSILAKDVVPWKDCQLPKISATQNNRIHLRGTLQCKPIFRTTPKKRKITELVIAVERNSGKFDYIPCIAWNEDAVKASKFKANDEIQLSGRIQSRIYTQNGKPRQVNEISIRELGLVGSGPKRIA